MSAQLPFIAAIADKSFATSSKVNGMSFPIARRSLGVKARGRTLFLHRLRCLAYGNSEDNSLTHPFFMAINYVHWIQTGTSGKTGFLTADIYQSIGADVGITKLASADKVDNVVRIGDAIRQGLMMRLRVRYTTGTETKSCTILCDIDKVPSAIAALITRPFKTGEIRSVAIMRRRRRG